MSNDPNLVLTSITREEILPLIFMVKIKVLPVESTKEYEGTGSTAPTIFNLDTIR